MRFWNVRAADENSYDTDKLLEVNEKLAEIHQDFDHSEFMTFGNSLGNSFEFNFHSQCEFRIRKNHAH